MVLLSQLEHQFFHGSCDTPSLVLWHFHFFFCCFKPGLKIVTFILFFRCHILEFNKFLLIGLFLFDRIFFVLIDSSKLYLNLHYLFLEKLLPLSSWGSHCLELLCSLFLQKEHLLLPLHWSLWLQQFLMLSFNPLTGLYQLLDVTFNAVHCLLKLLQLALVVGAVVVV